MPSPADTHETTDPPESSPPLFRGFRDRLRRARRGPLLAWVLLLCGIGVVVAGVLFVGLACKSPN
jgi:hypothetical protein